MKVLGCRKIGANSMHAILRLTWPGFEMKSPRQEKGSAPALAGS